MWLKKKNVHLIIFYLCCFNNVNIEASNFNTKVQDNISDSIHKRKYEATRLTGKAPKIDGKLDDECWKTGNWSQEFVQRSPVEGAKASQKTILKILYDDMNIYVALRCYDTEPDKIQNYTVKRDEYGGDIAGVCFDSYFDHVTGYGFDLTAGGSKMDYLIRNDGIADLSWDAVWYGNTAIEDSAWTVEIQIPLSQLRYNSKSDQIWGMHSWRWINRKQETDQWSLIPRNNSGFVYNLGELHGIKNLPKSKRIELMPYILDKVIKNHGVSDNPFTGKYQNTFSGGLDGKAGIGSDFTMNMTVNPDFGQVEADPSVINLTAFETFYNEKRPFFLEGKNIFDFNMDDDLVFYSRRIGHAPLVVPDENSDLKKFVKAPANTPIIDAVKFSGKTADGLSIGIMQSFTSSVYSKVSDSGKLSNVISDPYTNYIAGRIQKEYNSGNTILGSIFTGTIRSIHNEELNSLNKASYTWGMDYLHYWNKRNYYISLQSMYSRVEGSQKAILELQESAVHNYQRPDAGYLGIDSARRSLSGNGGSITIGKAGQDKLRMSEKILWRSPGFDLNEIGYLKMADYLRQQINISYYEIEPKSIFREYSMSLINTADWNFGGLNQGNNSTLSFNGFFTNQWNISLNLSRIYPGYDTRILRSGPALKLDPIWNNSFYINNDWASKIYFWISFNQNLYKDRFSLYREIKPGILFRLNSRFNIRSEFDYAINKYDLQYITTNEDNPDKKYIMGSLNQKTISLTFRFDINITTHFSVQYYGSPFISTGKYDDFKRITNSRANIYEDRFRRINSLFSDNTYYVSEDGKAYQFSNSDFTKQEFRSNFVLRWEYKEGSVLYMVWTHQQTVNNNIYTPGISTNLNDLFTLPSDNIFLVKLNYYFSL